MIVAAGLTPAWQQILSIPGFRIDAVNRTDEAVWCASGKVLNVGMALHSLGASAKTLGMIGGPEGDRIREEFAERNIDVEWIETQAATRICTTILDPQSHQTTELVENSPPVNSEELEQFRRAFHESAASADWVVLTGSLPVGVSPELYRDLLKLTSARSILDIRCEELHLAMTTRPFLVKPNREELSRTVQRELPTDCDVLAAMREFNERGAEWVVVTNGPESVLATSAEQSYRLTPPRVPVVNPIGCGDCFAAGLAWAFDAGASPKEAMRLGVASAGANLGGLLPARLNPGKVRQIAKTVRIESL